MHWFERIGNGPCAGCLFSCTKRESPAPRADTRLRNVGNAQAGRVELVARAHRADEADAACSQRRASSSLAATVSTASNHKVVHRQINFVRICWQYRTSCAVSPRTSGLMSFRRAAIASTLSCPMVECRAIICRFRLLMLTSSRSNRSISAMPTAHQRFAHISADAADAETPLRAPDARGQRHSVRRAKSSGKTVSMLFTLPRLS